MIVRIDTTNITRGREFTLYANNPNNETVTMRGLNVLDGSVVSIPHTAKKFGLFDGYVGVAPHLDGYLLATVSTQKVVKKIGNPQPAFVIGYKTNYTVPYKAYDGGGIEIASGNLIALVDGFYFTQIPYDTAVVTTLSRNFIVNKNLLKMNYDVAIVGGSLNSTYENLVLNSATLPDVVLPTNTLGASTLASTLPDVTITEL